MSASCPLSAAGEQDAQEGGKGRRRAHKPPDSAADQCRPYQPPLSAQLADATGASAAAINASVAIRETGEPSYGSSSRVRSGSPGAPLRRSGSGVLPRGRPPDDQRDPQRHPSPRPMPDRRVLLEHRVCGPEALFRFIPLSLLHERVAQGEPGLADLVEEILPALEEIECPAGVILCRRVVLQLPMTVARPPRPVPRRAATRPRRRARRRA